MLVWGGSAGGRLSVGDGAAYDPRLDRWRPVEGPGAPTARASHTAIFTGAEMIVWGGEDLATRGLLGDGAAYDVARGAWRTLPTDGAPSARRYHTAAWTGSEMIIWGGDRDAVRDEGLADGRRYDPLRDRWRAMNGNGAPAARWAHATVWTGKQLLVWGGLGCARTRGGEPLLCGDGAAYDPTTDTWMPIAAGGGAPSARSGHSVVWTGSRMLVWGGSAEACVDGTSGPCSDGSAYDPETRRWSPLPSPAPAEPRAGHIAVWLGRQMFVWGGVGPGGEAPRHDGALYEP